MPSVRAPRSGVTRAASAAALLLALTGCSLFDRDAGAGAEQSGPGASATGAPSAASASASVSSVRETCSRVLETARTAPEQLREDPLGLLAEIDELARTAPEELSGQLSSVREAVEGFRQGDRSFISVVQEARALQERCSA